MPMDTASQRRSANIVLLSFEGKGHINPFMMLAKHLARLGLSVTVVFTTEFALSLISAGHDATDGLDINLVSLPGEGEDAGNPIKDRVLVMQGIRKPISRDAYNESPVSSLQRSLKTYIEQLTESSSPPVAVILDLLFPWACAPIDELGLPRYVFYTAAASHLAVVIHLNANEHVDKKMLETEGVVKVPGLPILRWTDVSNEMKDESDPFFLGKNYVHEVLLQSKGILMNTSYALEGKVIDALVVGHPEARFIPIGPIFPAAFFTKVEDLAEEIRKSTILPSIEEARCMNWLSSKCPSSVIFISFGSWARLSDKQIGELALGLEASNKPFLWVLRVLNGEMHRVLPEGFHERTENRGLIVSGWAPQQLILSHPSVGGFVTHCGWNSVTECITLAGVPMLGWPFIADQPLICRYLVEELKIAVDIHENEDGLAESCDIEKALKTLMEDLDLRARAKKMRESVRKAVNPDQDGSSQRNLEAFVQCLKKGVDA